MGAGVRAPRILAVGQGRRRCRTWAQPRSGTKAKSILCAGISVPDLGAAPLRHRSDVNPRCWVPVPDLGTAPLRHQSRRQSSVPGYRCRIWAQPRSGTKATSILSAGIPVPDLGAAPLRHQSDVNLRCRIWAQPRSGTEVSRVRGGPHAVRALFSSRTRKHAVAGHLNWRKLALNWVGGAACGAARPLRGWSSSWPALPPCLPLPFRARCHGCL